MIIVYDKNNNNKIFGALHEPHGEALELNAILRACELAGEKELGRFGTFKVTDEFIIDKYLTEGIDTIKLEWDNKIPIKAIYEPILKPVTTLNLNEIKQNKKEEIAQARYEAEISGIEIDGLSFSTDRESRLLLNEAAFHSILDPEYLCKWKANNGTFYLNATQIINITKAVRAYVQEQFDKELRLLELLELATTKNKVNQINWDINIYSS